MDTVKIYIIYQSIKISLETLKIPVPLVNGQIIMLEHVNQKTYLHSTDSYLKEKSWLSKQQNKYVVGAQPVQADRNNLWQVVRTTPYSLLKNDAQKNQSEIHYDDCIMLCHYDTCRFLTNYGNIQSQTTKQGEISCMDNCSTTGEQIFMFQKIFDPYIDAHNPNFVMDNRVYSHTKLRIISVSDDRALHTHSNQYSQPDVNNLKEVTSYPNRDDNDFWELQIADEQILRGFKILQNSNKVSERLVIQIHPLDKVIIRSCFMGTSLHSHKDLYLKGSKEQEVTCRAGQPRDENDWWQILSINDNIIYKSVDKFNRIQHLSRISLMHWTTKKYLTASPDFKSPSGKGIEVCCKQGSPKDGEWQLIVLQSDQQIDSLTQSYPFVIKHLPTGQYLTTFKSPSKPTDFQMEMGLMNYTSHATVWQIEQQESIYS